jgi:hypothetical protein
LEPAPVSIALPSIVREAPAPAPPLLPFPTPDQIPSGLDGEIVVERYGEPAISTIASDKEHVVENFVYARNRGEAQTLIRMEDGKVSLVASDIGPPSVVTPTPLRRLHR